MGTLKEVKNYDVKMAFFFILEVVKMYAVNMPFCQDFNRRPELAMLSGGPADINA